MKDLINKIATHLGFKAISDFKFEKIDLSFYYFEDKKVEDYYLFAFVDLSVLANSIKDSKIEYYLNSMVLDLKETKLIDFNNKAIDRNLSLIIVLNKDEDDEKYKLHKIEENYFVAKKYVLAYTNEELIGLNENLIESENIISSLNELAINNGHLLNEPNQSKWYNFIMKLFIKIPFLNYEISEDSKQVLDKVEDKISTGLNEKQQELFDLINSEYNDSNADIESFIEDNNLLNGRSNDV